MKTHLWKKAAALALVLSLFVSLLSLAAAAGEPGDEETTPDTPVTERNPEEPPEVSPGVTPEESPGVTPEVTRENPPEGTVPDGTQPTQEPEDKTETCANGEHTVSGGPNPPNYSVCTGGYQAGWWACDKCGTVCDASGKELVRQPGNGEGHKLTSSPTDSTYAPCGGGYENPFYTCVICYQAFIDQEAKNPAQRKPPDEGAPHNLGDQPCRANYTPCYGGYMTEWYVCKDCSHVVDADGTEINLSPGDGTPHHIVGVPGREPTEDQDGWLGFWRCDVCFMSYEDSEGKVPLHSNIARPALKETRTEPLNEVPTAVSGTYTTVEDIQTELLKTAETAGFAPNQTNADSILLDITLQEMNQYYEWVDVAPEDFPEEGAIVRLPYPEGTDPSYTFVITHMITQGEHAGETEVLWSVNAEDGIYVYFTSMSPMSIAYMPQGSTPAPAASAPDSTVPKTSDANHGAPWGMLALLSIAGSGALLAAGSAICGVRLYPARTHKAGKE